MCVAVQAEINKGGDWQCWFIYCPASGLSRNKDIRIIQIIFIWKYNVSTQLWDVVRYSYYHINKNWILRIHRLNIWSTKKLLMSLLKANLDSKRCKHSITRFETLDCPSCKLNSKIKDFPEMWISNFIIL